MMISERLMQIKYADIKDFYKDVADIASESISKCGYSVLTFNDNSQIAFEFKKNKLFYSKTSYWED